MLISKTNNYIKGNLLMCRLKIYEVHTNKETYKNINTKFDVLISHIKNVYSLL